MNVIASKVTNVAAAPLIVAGRPVPMLNAGHELLPHLNRGRSIGAADRRPLMTHAFSGSDTEFWSWEGAFEATETAKALLRCKFGAVIARANAPEVALGLRRIAVATLK
ncbi:hypothetical protein GGE07_003982 [Sinorhizobium terangae]|uniref:Uncharacterized protein n=1 Tax=Sinorhizobium terangae TaxID=110322 RepID=A0A6N7LA16_SINTE|nr:hypothetical protein [Sinorhizobium terangae]MBB4187318.1 hypothetical protein [Sinorhizobium terangae]MQX14661.1 hypothetical protein [Sinorhizobium terangae]